jgi:hypothetical protein
VVVFFSSFPAAFVFVFIITRRCRFIVVGVFGNFLCALLENEAKVAAALVLVASVVVVIAILDVLSGWFYVENKARLCYTFSVDFLLSDDEFLLVREDFEGSQSWVSSQKLTHQKKKKRRKE